MVKARYKQTEIGEIPEDWDACLVGDHVQEISMGPFGSDIKVSNFKSVGVPVLSGDNLRSHRLKDGFKNFLTPEKAKSLNKAVARRGDVIVTHRGTLGQIAFIPKDSEFEEYVISQSQFRVRFKSELNPAWGALYFLSRKGADALLEGKGHTGVPAIAQATTTFRKLFIPLPPIDEQNRIVETLSGFDALIVTLEKLIAKKRDIKTATTQQLLTGKKRLPGFQREWKVRRINELAEVDPENLSASTNPLYEFRYISLEDVDRGRLSGHSQQVFSTSPSRARRILRMNDVVVSTVRPNLKSHFLFQRNEKDWVCSTGFSVIRCDPRRANAQFIFQHFFAREIELQIETLIAGSSYPAINSGDVKKLAISCPEVDEQAAIALVLSDMDREIHVLEKKLNKARVIKLGMMQELLTGRTRLL